MSPWCDPDRMYLPHDPYDVCAALASSADYVPNTPSRAPAILITIRAPAITCDHFYPALQPAIMITTTMPSFYIEQFGCRATQADAAALERQLRDRGCQAARDSTSAEVVVVNTCTVTAAADAQARDAIRKIHAANPAAQIIATGCYAQRAPEELAALPGVTWVVGNSHKPQNPNFFPHTGESLDAPIQSVSIAQPNVIPAT